MKKIIICVIVILGILSINIYSSNNIENVGFNGVVTASTLNIRQGPGMNYEITGSINKDSNVNVIGKMDDWYIVQTESNIIGVCNSEYIKDVGQLSDIDKILKIENEKRNENNVKNLTLDNDLCEVAKIKLQDMVDNQYFSHVSDKLGTPIDILNNNNIEYMTIGENLSKGYDVDETINMWLNSEIEKNNILSNGYNTTGIAVMEVEGIGKMYVQIFVGK